MRPKKVTPPPVMDYFTEDKEKEVWTCNVEIEGETEEDKRPCGSEFSCGDKDLNKGNRMGNLRRHLRRYHSDEFEEMEKKEKKQAGAISPGVSRPLGRQTSVVQFFQAEQITIKMTKARFVDGIVTMVAKDGIPLRFFSSEGSKQLLGEMAKKVGVSLDRNRVRDYVINAAEELKTKVKADLRDKFVHLKFDCATRIRTNYIGVNARYINSDNNAVTTTLSVTDTKSQHTSSELKVLLHNILEEFDIPLNHVLCCVTDNASNMIRVVKDLNQDLAAMLPSTAASGSGNL